MSAKTFIDTLFVIALINRRDQYHERAVELARQYESQRFLITDAVFLEIGNALAKSFRGQAAQIINHFLSSPDVKVVQLTPQLLAQALELFTTHSDKEWGLVDCVSFVAMKQAGIVDALTFDQHFVQAGFRAVMRNEKQ